MNNIDYAKQIDIAYQKARGLSTSEEHEQALFFACIRSFDYRSLVDSIRGFGFDVECPKSIGTLLLALTHAVPNGGSRGSTQRARAINGSKLKTQGVLAGVPDVFLPLACKSYHGLYLEFKAPSRSTVSARPWPRDRALSEEQRVFFNMASLSGYCCSVAYSAEHALAILVNYISGPD